jgi:cephalosporin hydroxylase
MMSMVERSVRVIKNPRKLIDYWRRRREDWAIALDTLTTPRNYRECKPSDFGALNEVKKHSLTRTDMSDHLVTLFYEAIGARPKLIVELGVRQGESTFVLERVARLRGAALISVDLDDCSEASSYEGWRFVRSDDIAFAGRFKEYCRGIGVEPQIDVLFIDSSHLFEHTVQEIEHWFPLMAPRAKAIFHDTNLKETYFYKDGAPRKGWDNQRGVIAAIEKYFGRPFDEEREFAEKVGGWLVKHYPYCSGFTILEKLPPGGR